MSIIIVSGPACAGKSTFIKKTFPDRTIIDLKDFQDKYPVLTYENVAKSYDDCKKALITAIKEGKEVVLEHTLLREIRRKVYIDAIKEVTNDEIIIYCFKPSLELLVNRVEERCGKRGEADAKNSLNTLEIPTFAEGYSQIFIIKDDEIVEQIDCDAAIKKFVAATVTNDEETASKVFEAFLDNEPENVPNNFLEKIKSYATMIDEAENENKLEELATEWLNFYK